jgi:hypothetical protein
MTTSDKPPINHHHALHEEEKGEISLPMTRQIADLAIRMLCTRHTKGTNASSGPTLEGHAPVAFLFKNYLFKSLKHPSWLCINKKTYVKRQNHPWTLPLFFFDSKGRKVLSWFFKKHKGINTLSQQFNFFSAWVNK